MSREKLIPIVIFSLFALGKVAQSVQREKQNESQAVVRAMTTVEREIQTSDYLAMEQKMKHISVSFAPKTFQAAWHDLEQQLRSCNQRLLNPPHNIALEPSRHVTWYRSQTESVRKAINCLEEEAAPYVPDIKRRVLIRTHIQQKLQEQLQAQRSSP